MRLIAVYIFILLGINVYSQTKPQKEKVSKSRNQIIIKKGEVKHTNFGIGIGLARSVIFLSRNIKDFNDASGLNLNMIYGGNNLVRFGFDYNQYNSLNIEPTWYNVRAKTYEANLQFLARFNGNKALIYPIVGFSVNQFKGFFTGKDDFQDLREKYKINSEVNSFWVGMNFGLGYEHKLGPFKLTLSYKMRLGFQDVDGHLNIIDVCYSAGLRYDIKALTPKYIYRSIFRSKTKNRYLLDV